MFRRQQLRRWAAHVLVLWLLGVGTAIANTCLMPNRAPLGHPPEVHLAEGERADQASSCDGDHGHAGPAVHSNCADFCDKASISMPPLKSVLDDGQAHALAYPAILLVHPGPAPMPVSLKVPRRDGVWAPPIPITFLRLAL